MMRALHYDPYQAYSNPDMQRDEDSEEIAASFLLAMKHRSVTPDHSSTLSSGAVSSPPKKTKGSKRSSYKSFVLEPSSELNQSFDAPVQMLSSSSSANHCSDSDGSTADIQWEELLDNSKLVLPKDRDLVPDALFVAMAQMTPCRLTQADRVGCYKAREIGFVGMCCKHCGGQPGFGRYYPNSVRSLAQTTTSQTILKHVGSKCRFCPAPVRDAVQELQRQQAIREAMASGRPRYGSRKIFFQRVWNRLHGDSKFKVHDEEDEEEEISKNQDDMSEQTPSDCDEESSTLSSHATYDYEAEAAPMSTVISTSNESNHPHKRKNGRYVALPMNRNKRMRPNPSSS